MKFCKILLIKISLLQIVTSMSFIDSDDDNSIDFILLSRERRDTNHYHPLESPGLRSHFHIDPDNNVFTRTVAKKYNIQRGSRSKRETSLDSSGNEESFVKLDSIEDLPTAEKQFAEEDGYVKKLRAAPNKYDFMSKMQDEEVRMSADASVNEGIKTRAPRVNFVTQQKKSLEAAEARERPTIAKPADYYMRSAVGNGFQTMDKYYYDDSRRYDTSPRKYERYDRALDYYPRYEDDYAARNPNSFYYYPNSQYDLPEPREYPPYYTNEIDRMSPPGMYPSAYNMNNKRRIIYYATLPEVVRTPPNVDLRYRSYQYDGYNNRPPLRYDPYYYNNYQPYDSYRSNRSPRYYYNNNRASPPLMGSPTTSSSSSHGNSDNQRENKPSTANQVRVASNSVKVQDQQKRGSAAVMEHRNFNDNPSNLPSNSGGIAPSSHGTYQDGVEDRDQTYFSRNH